MERKFFTVVMGPLDDREHIQVLAESAHSAVKAWSETVPPQSPQTILCFPSEDWIGQGNLPPTTQMFNVVWFPSKHCAQVTRRTEIEFSVSFDGLEVTSQLGMHDLLSATEADTVVRLGGLNFERRMADGEVFIIRSVQLFSERVFGFKVWAPTLEDAIFRMRCWARFVPLSIIWGHDNTAYVPTRCMIPQRIYHVVAGDQRFTVTAESGEAAARQCAKEVPSLLPIQVEEDGIFPQFRALEGGKVERLLYEYSCERLWPLCHVPSAVSPPPEEVMERSATPSTAQSPATPPSPAYCQGSKATHEEEDADWEQFVAVVRDEISDSE